MAIKELITDPEVLVNSKVWNVRTNHDIMVNLIRDLEDTLKERTDRLFLCSNEIGYEERAILVKFADDTHEFINPAFQKRDVPIINREKDIITGEEYLVPRFTTIEIVYQDCLGSVKAYKLNQAASVVMCQAMDMLNGITASDYGLPILEGFDDLSSDEKAEIISEYTMSLKERYNYLDKELSNSNEVKDIWNASKYFKGIADGEIELDKSPDSNRKKKKLRKLVDDIKHQANKMKFWGRKR